MKLVGRVPVEPLDDERMTNIERRVVAGAADAAARPAPFRAPRRHLAFAAAAFAAAAAFVIGWKLRGAPAQAPAATETKLAVAGDTLDVGDATIHSDPGTEFDITRPDGGVLVGLHKGRVELHVGKRGDRPPLVVRAGDTDVIVVGTRFSVDYGDGTGDVDVRVTEGIVKVVRHHEELRVAAGSAWEPERGVIALGDARPTVVANAAGAPDGATIGDVSAKGSGAIEIDMGAGPDVLHPRTAQVPDERTPPPNRTTTASKPAPTEPTSKPGAGSAALDLRAQILAQPVEPALDVGERVAATAVSKYRQIMTSVRGPEASRALYSIAVLQHTKMGRNGDALQTLDMYLRRFVSGPEHSAALWLRVRILCTTAIDDRCRQAAYAYAHQVPESPAAHLAELITITE